MSLEPITIEAHGGAPVEHVWSCWTQPEHITQWNFASPDWCCPSADNDLRPGGRYRARMEARDGSFGFDFEATWDEVTPYTALAYTLDDGRHARTTFESAGDTTRVRTTFDAEGQNPVEMQRAGWQAILDSFKGYTEGQQSDAGSEA